MVKGLKLKVRKSWGLVLTFVEVKGEKLEGGGAFCLPLCWIGLKKEKLRQKYFSGNIGWSSKKLQNNDIYWYKSWCKTIEKNVK